MRKFKEYQIENPVGFKTKLLHWSAQCEHVSYLDSNKNHSTGSSAFGTQTHGLIAGVGSVKKLKAGKNAFEDLKKFHSTVNDWIFGHFSYDLKNKIEKLESRNSDRILFPEIHFFQPQFVFILQDELLKIGYIENLHTKKEIDALLKEIANSHKSKGNKKDIRIRSKISKKEYIEAVCNLKDHIQQGDIYEVNFCQEFYAENAWIDPVDTYQNLNTISETPFAAFYRLDDKYLMCASPERFLKKSGKKLISQPIKGTIKRSPDQQEDERLKNTLLNDPKEKSENIMIVDLVRNDLSRTAKQGSVKVEELSSIYSFLQVHQMISTVSSELRDDVHFIDAIKNAFPMGSMTGVPKIRAMELIEKYESTKRGLYSGALGYITPEGNFDFNVVIRSILYNTKNRYLSFMAGGAITARSIAEKEYEECMLKAKAMFKATNNE